VQVRASTQGRLDAWIDFNNNGSWADPGENIFDNLPVAAGDNILTFAVPGVQGDYNTFARFRFSDRDLTFTGPAPLGEVEDYQVYVYPRPVVVTKGEAKRLPLGTNVLLLRNIVTANFGWSGWYIEEPDRSSGIGTVVPAKASTKPANGWGWSVGDVVSCYGQTLLQGCELKIWEIYSWKDGEDTISPLSQNNRQSGGGPIYQTRRLRGSSTSRG